DRPLAGKDAAEKERDHGVLDVLAVEMARDRGAEFLQGCGEVGSLTRGGYAILEWSAATACAATGNNAATPAPVKNVRRSILESSLVLWAVAVSCYITSFRTVFLLPI